MGEIHHAADAEDQRQAQRNQQIIAAEHEAIYHLFQQEPELHSRSRETLISAAPRCAVMGVSRRARQGAPPRCAVMGVSRRARQGAPADRPRGYNEQGFCSLVGLRTSIGSFGPGTAAPSVMRSHLSLAWPF